MQEVKTLSFPPGSVAQAKSAFERRRLVARCHPEPQN